MTIKTSKTPPVRAVASKPLMVFGTWLGGGAGADCTRQTGRGITSVKYNSAAGRYIIKFDDVGEGTSPTLLLNVQGAAGAATSFMARPTVYSASGKTFTLDVTDLATPTNHDLATTEVLHIVCIWDDNDAP